MAQAARYASRSATFGSVAYDFDALQRGFDEAAWEAPERDYREQTAPARPKERERARVRMRVRPAALPVSVSAFSVIGLLAAAVLMMFVILSYVQITELNDAKTQLRAQLSELDMEREHLRVDYETTFNLNEIEDYATHTLGMVRLTESSTATVASHREDRGVVLSGESTGDGAFSGFGGFIRSLLEYLK